MSVEADYRNADVDYNDEGGAKLFERSRIKALADEREMVQKKTFTKWVNSHLQRVSCRIVDLYTDLRDGRMLIRLLEVLSGERLPKPTKGKMRIHCLENCDKALKFLKEKRVHLENMGSHDITDGNHRLTLGLIWTIILRFQIQDITIEDDESDEKRSAKDALLLWCQMKTAGYKNVNVRNFTNSWRDGLAFNALIHKHRPDLIEYNKLQKSQPVYNLNNAFNTAEQKLGLVKLLDTEDINIDHPDEKSIMTYVVTYYHYFSKMKTETVMGKRITNVMTSVRENDKLIKEYEKLTSDLLRWIEHTVQVLGDRTFANSLTGVQQQLLAFNFYRTVEKPPKFMEKGNLEVLLFTIQSKMRANNQKPYLPKEGKLISDINKAWEKLERSEHERELALRQELIRQEKLEQLAERFDRKAAMREVWLGDNQRLVSQDNFGYDLPAVEAAAKKHEAIETDINAYEERVLTVVAVAEELESENYHDIEKINVRKENVLRLWAYLLELLKNRRLRLDYSLEIQKIFQEMELLLDSMEETKGQLLSEDYGRHLMDVEDLLEKHALLEADVSAYGERVNMVNQQADRFVDEKGVDGTGYTPVDPMIVKERIANLEESYQELQNVGHTRKDNLKESCKLWKFFWDLADDENWIKEMEQVLSSGDIGRDLTSVNLLLNKHKALEQEMSGRQTQLEGNMKAGEDLINEGHRDGDKIKARNADIQQNWEKLTDLSQQRKNRLNEATDMYQFFADADDVDIWMLDTLRLVSSEDVGHDQASTESLIKKHKIMTTELDNYSKVIGSLHEQADQLGDQDRDSPEVQARLGTIDRRYKELKDLNQLRKQRLIDALSLFKLFNEADNVEAWIDEKEQTLQALHPGEDLESNDILLSRFGRLEKEVEINASKVAIVNQLARQLLQSEHPNSPEINQKQNHLNQRWHALRELLDARREAILTSRGIQTYHIECIETTTWIRDKMKVIAATEELGNDLAGVTALQRRLKGMESDITAIEAKLDDLKKESDKLAQEHPEEEEQIKARYNDITEAWVNLNDVLKERESALADAGDLHQFLGDLDEFQVWLTKTQTAIASEDIPNSLKEAEKSLNKHAAIKDEIDGYEDKYAQLKETGERVTEGQTDAQYVFLKQRLQALDDGWIELHQMWDNRQHLLSQALNHQMFVRDARLADIILNQQDNFLANIKQPHSLEAAEEAIKKHENFISQMDNSDEKINTVITFANKLCDENHYAADKINKKAENIDERRKANRQAAEDALDKLRDQCQLQAFLEEAEELDQWITEKMVIAQEETYDEARNLHSKWQKHQAFEKELVENRERLDKLREHGDQLVQEKPEMKETVEEQLQDLEQKWQDLEDTTKSKGKKLFEANSQALFSQGCDDLDNWITDLETQVGHDDTLNDLVTVQNLLKKQQMLESQVMVKKSQVNDLHCAVQNLENLDEIEKVTVKKQAVEERFMAMSEPLTQRRAILENAQKGHKLIRDFEDEKAWIQERMPPATSQDIGNNLQAVQTLQKKNNSLKAEVDGHEPRIVEVCDRGRAAIDENHPFSDQIDKSIGEVNDQWEKLKDAVDARKDRLIESEKAQRYYFDANEAEAWMSEQELYMMAEERGKDDSSAMAMMKKHNILESAVEDYADTINDLSKESRKLMDENHSQSDQIAIRQSQIDKLYAGLKDLSQERRHRLEEAVRLFQLNREVDDLEQWIAEREVVAGSHELGQDFEHVTMLQDRFRAFASETISVGTERVNKVNKMADDLIEAEHSDAPTIAEWKEGLNEAWADLRELIDTRTQMLAASYELHKFHHDAKETLGRIQEKQNSMSEDLGKDGNTVTALQRKHEAFETDLKALAFQVKSVQEDAGNLRAAYAGDKARDIDEREREVVEAWNALKAAVSFRTERLHDTLDLYRFLNMVRALQLWMDDISIQINTQEKPRDITGVELLINHHQNIRSEIDTRNDSFTDCFTLGKDMLAKEHYASKEIREKLVTVGNQRCAMIADWEHRWEYLLLIQEVYQFARDAHIAEAWLIMQEPYLKSEDYGNSLDEVEKLIKKHEAFEKAAATQHDRFIALEKLTTFELKELRRKKAEERRALNSSDEDIPPIKEAPSLQHLLVEEFLQTESEREKDDEKVEYEEPKQDDIQINYSRHMVDDDDQQVVSERLDNVKHEMEAAINVFNGESAESDRNGSNELLNGDEEHAQSTPSTISERKEDVAEGSSRGDAPSFQAEGNLIRKHEMESNNKKAHSRSWHQVFCVQQGSDLFFYKDQKSISHGTYHGEPPISLISATIAVADDYTKKKHVFRIRLNDGNAYLFQCKDSNEVKYWIDCLNEASKHPTDQQKSATMPADTGAGKKPKSGKGFFTLKK
ncbi:spectrin beta chain-like isoform X2 [Antedon mediterranea]|uniref:spectrin beta chain-like isoform X2 n=1 Tax=Antedon mediterranea TaxID=105859 RepID=UPI003AF47405